MTALLLEEARLPGTLEPVDVRIEDGRVAAIVPHGADASGGVLGAVRPGGPTERMRLGGRWLVPGLHDRHVHMSQWAMVARRLDLAEAGSAAETAALVAGAVRGGASEVAGFGYRDGLWPDAPSLALLDRVSGDVPVMLVAADLHACWLNSAAARRYGARPGDDGVLREDDCFRLVRELDDVADDVLDTWVAEAAVRASARGVVGVTDYEMRWNRDDWARRGAGGAMPLRVAFGVYPQHLERAISEGLRTGESLPGTHSLVRVGAAKVITDGSLNTRTALCFDPYPGLEGLDHAAGLATVAYDELVPLMRRASDAGLAPAVHAIGDRANARVLDAFEAVGCRGSIEHAQLLRHEDVARFARLGVVASVQPEHAMDDRDVADRYWTGRTDRAFMLAELFAAGVELALGSDAPVAPLDPWVAISAAVGRSRGGREPWHPEQAVDVRVALAASTNGAGAEVRAGAAADLAVVELDPFTASVDQLRGMPVAATFLAGRATHSLLG
ncbi:amidohydrolase [Agromyces aerolatus]|uniref:amidohydrolase n=1 Tax=Agromyces sp. LY-1074 TaxID=3074080 RepID=UPI00285C54F6|nr:MULTISPECIES: amidohydrolase family protein [unclassified Agromyces]MDR5699871.1 amidohydrolase family protein [Agromyces sp. LY-1074]MDR5706317.1 amidohydrolase family protein [Agromyces sp. LY-1358]